MSAEQSYTFYTYSRSDDSKNDRWAYTGVPDIFFDDADSARRALLEMRKEMTVDHGESWSPMRLEKIETLPITKETILALLNDGMGALLKSYEIIDVID